MNHTSDRYDYPVFSFKSEMPIIPYPGPKVQFRLKAELSASRLASKAGILSTVTDPENQVTSYTYDDVGRVTEVSRPDGSTVGYTYDQNGNMTFLTNPVLVNHNFGYNFVNRASGTSINKLTIHAQTIVIYIFMDVP